MANMLTVHQDPHVNEETANCQLYVRTFYLFSYLFIYLFTESFTNTRDEEHGLIDNRRVDIQNLVSQRRKGMVLIKEGELMKKFHYQKVG